MSEKQTVNLASRPHYVWRDKKQQAIVISAYDKIEVS